MTRRLLDPLTVVSLLPCVAVAALWALSCQWSWALGYYASGDAAGFYRDYYVHSENARVSYIWFRQNSPSTPRRDCFLWHRRRASQADASRPWTGYNNDRGFGLLGLGYEHVDHSPNQLWYTLTAPHWLIVTLLAVWPVRRLRRRRPRTGLCPHCG